MGLDRADALVIAGVLLLALAAWLLGGAGGVLLIVGASLVAVGVGEARRARDVA